MNLRRVVIQTKRLLLVPISETDISDVFHHFTTNVSVYMYPVPTGEIEDTKEFVTTAVNKLDAKKDLQMVIKDKNDDAFLGCCGLHGINSLHPELGIWLKMDAHGLGLGKEAIEGLVSWGRENLEYDFFKYPVDRRNISSRKIPESYHATVVKEYVITNQAGKPLDIMEFWFK